MAYRSCLVAVALVALVGCSFGKDPTTVPCPPQPVKIQTIEVKVPVWTPPDVLMPIKPRLEPAPGPDAAPQEHAAWSADTLAAIAAYVYELELLIDAILEKEPTE